MAVMGESAAAHASDIAGLLQDGDGDVRKSACAALAVLGEAGAEHTADIVECLADADAEVRGAAVNALANLGEAAAPHAPQIMTCLVDQSVEVRRTACEALGQLGNERASEVLVPLLGDRDADVQEAAAEAIHGLQAGTRFGKTCTESSERSSRR